VAAAVGAAVVIALVAWFGARAIGREVWQAAWVLPPILALFFVQLWLSGAALRRVTGGGEPGLAAWFWVRWVIEAINALLPVAQIGGNVVGVRLLTARGVEQPRAAAGMVLDLTVEAATQTTTSLTAIAVLLWLVPDRHWWPWVAGAAAFLIAGLAGFIAAQRFGLLRLIEAAAARFSHFLPGVDLSGMQAIFTVRARDVPALAAGYGLHICALLLGTVETWLVLSAMGHPPGLAEAFVLESLGFAARSAAFAVPGALGAQEAGFLLVGSLFGLPAETAVALSMVKRLRELLVGVGGLVSWRGSAFLARRRREAASS
jgi:putative membrane protein